MYSGYKCFSDKWFAHIFSMNLVFSLLEQKFYFFIKFTLPIFSFMDSDLLYLRITCLTQSHRNFYIFFLKVLYFYVSYLSLQFKLIFVQVFRYKLRSFFFLCLRMYIVCTPFVEKIILSLFNCFCNFVRSNLTIFMWYVSRSSIWVHSSMSVFPWYYTVSIA